MHIKITNRRKGYIAESLAVDFLKNNRGIRLLDRNSYHRTGEIDIIAFDNIRDEIIFIEVRSHFSDKGYSPEESVRGKKLHRLLSAIRKYLFINKLESRHWRIDIMALNIDITRATNVRYRLKWIKNISVQHSAT